MLGRKPGFQAQVKAVSPSVTSVHYFTHGFALAAKLLLLDMKASLNMVVKMVNYIETLALNSRLFKVICEDIRSKYMSLLFHCGGKVAVSRKYQYASFCDQKEAASVFPNRRSQILEDS